MTRPQILLKLATSLDGRIATASGESRWISGQEARVEAHRLRAACDAILVGSGTALDDDPELTVRLAPPPPTPPLRVVLDTRLRLPLRARLIATLSDAPLLVIGREGADPAAQKALTEAGAEVALVKRHRAGVDLDAALAVLKERHGVRRVMVESGGGIAASLIGARLVDRLEWVRAPILLGAEGRPAIDTLGLKRLSDAPAFRRLATRAFGADLWESYERA